MGETGCGKTRLIRFMCDMIAVSAGEGIDCDKNMLIMKVLYCLLLKESHIRVAILIV